MRYNRRNHKKQKSIFLKLVFLSLFCGLLLPKNGYAYLDPGTGSYIIQLLLAAVLGIGVGVRLFWGKIKKALNNIFSKKNRLE